MNIYKVLNEITDYIDKHIEEKIDYNHLAKLMGTNSYTMQRVFSVIANIPLAEYIRKRKLSIAAYELLTTNIKVMDLAIKYNYESATSFSRAFEAFHNIKPSEVSTNSKVKEFPRLTFNEDIVIKKDMEYQVVELPRLILYGLATPTNNNTIGTIAPNFYRQMDNKYNKELGPVNYGMTTYDEARAECNHYYILYEKKHKDLEKIEIAPSKYLKFRVESQEAKDIQEVSNRFYEEFFPYCKYNLNSSPELEHYHDNITDFLIPID